MDAFDEHMKQLAGSFEKQPEHNLWPGIEAALQRKKRRRLAGWWLLPLLLAGTGLWMYLPQSNMQQPDSTTITANKQLKQAAPSPGLEALQPQATGTQQVATTSGKKTNELHTNTPQQKGAKPTAANNPTRTPATTQVPGGTHPTYTQPIYAGKSRQASVVKTIFATPPQSTTLNTPTTATDTITAVVTPNNPQAIASYYQVDTADAARTTDAVETADSLSAKKGTTEVDTTATLLAITQPEVKAQPKNKPAQWRMIAGAGMHNLAGGKMLQWTESDAALNVGNLQGTLPGTAGNPLLQSVRPGGGFVLGLERLQPFAKGNAWNWSVAAIYQYQRIRQQSGQRVTDSSDLSQRLNSSFVYMPGSDLNTTGWQHRLHLSTGLSWERNRWQLAGKVYGGTVLAHRYLMPLGPGVGWVPSQASAARAYSGLEASIGYRIGNVLATFTTQQNLTRSARHKFLPEQYWRSMELRVAIPITFSTTDK